MNIISTEQGNTPVLSGVLLYELHGRVCNSQVVYTFSMTYIMGKLAFFLSN